MGNKNEKNQWSISISLIVGISIILVLTIVNLSYFIKNNEVNRNSEKTYKKAYDYQYVIVAGDTNETLWQNLYESAKIFGENNNAFIQFSDKNDLMNYTRLDLLKMAIASKVDGIIIEGIDSVEISNLIDKAVKNNIPVVTAVNDIYKSSRQSFVGVTNYDLGREYGRQIIEATDNDINNILILYNGDLENSSKNIIINGINETIKKEGGEEEYIINRLQVNNEQAFSGEEQIRDIFIGQNSIPDIIVCLDELNTISVYQAVVDFNAVGKTKIIGYNNSQIILKGISKNIIFSSIVLDTAKIGEECVKCLNEFNTTGNVNNFVAVDLYVIDSKNIGEYLADEESIKN